MSQYADAAEAMFKQGYNCAQAVLARCGGAGNLSHDQAVKVAAAFGGGIAHLDQTCGAVTGALMALGLRVATADAGGKHKAYAAAQEFARRFVARHASIRCTDLLGVSIATPEGLEQAKAKGLFKAACPKLVRDACDILDEILAEKPQ